jgi:hypothetical protein
MLVEQEIIYWKRQHPPLLIPAIAGKRFSIGIDPLDNTRFVLIWKNTGTVAYEFVTAQCLVGCFKELEFSDSKLDDNRLLFLDLVEKWRSIERDTQL